MYFSSNSGGAFHIWRQRYPDGMPEQLGMVGFFYPTQVKMTSGAFTSAYPDLINPVLTLNVYEGDLGIDDGTPRSVYTLDPTGMTQLTGGKTGVASIELAPGETQDLPNGLGTITLANESPAGAQGYEGSVQRFVSLSVHRAIKDALDPQGLLNPGKVLRRAHVADLAAADVLAGRA